VLARDVSNNDRLLELVRMDQMSVLRVKCKDGLACRLWRADLDSVARELSMKHREKKSHQKAWKQDDVVSRQTLRLLYDEGQNVLASHHKENSRVMSSAK